MLIARTFVRPRPNIYLLFALIILETPIHFDLIPTITNSLLYVALSCCWCVFYFQVFMLFPPSHWVRNFSKSFLLLFTSSLLLDVLSIVGCAVQLYSISLVSHSPRNYGRSDDFTESSRRVAEEKRDMNILQHFVCWAVARLWRFWCIPQGQSDKTIFPFSLDSHSTHSTHTVPEWLWRE